MKILLYISVLYTFFPLFLTDWLNATRQNIGIERILQVIIELSFTSCHLQCKRNEKCIFFGTSKRIDGGVGKCYFIGNDASKYSNQVTNRVKKLYVMEVLGHHPISVQSNLLEMSTPILLADREFQIDGNGRAVWGVSVNPNIPIYYLSDDKLDYSHAKGKCYSWGGDLTDVESKVIDKNIISAVAQKEPALRWWWIGYKYHPDKGYHWTNGANDTYNNLPAEKGAHCTVAGTKNWQKMPCGPTTMHYYVCKKKP